MGTVPSLLIRAKVDSDVDEVDALHRAAFGGDAEARLVLALREDPAFIPSLSLVAVLDDRIVGHLLLSRATVESPTEALAALALAPMAVAPTHQRRGIGTALLHRSIAEATIVGPELVIVVGHPSFYGRAGFNPAALYGIRAPFDVPSDAFRARWLGSAVPRRVDGVVRYAAALAALSVG